MERAKADIVGSTASELDKIAHHLDYVGGVKYALYCLFIDSFHILQCRCKDRQFGKMSDKAGSDFILKGVVCCT